MTLTNPIDIQAAAAARAAQPPAAKGVAELQPPPQVGFTIEKEHYFSAHNIRALAALIGDDNQLHHNAALAANFQFGDVIVAGGQTTAVMMSAISTGLMDLWPNIGLGYSAKFRRAIVAGEAVRIKWQVASCEHQPKLRGLVLKFEGTLTNEAGEAAIQASCDVLIPDGGYLSE